MAKKKRKSKLKKFLKGAALAGAVALGAKALANRNARASTNADAIRAMTSNDAYSDDTMPGNLSRNMGMKRRRRDSILASPVINKMDTSEVTIPENYFNRPSRTPREPITFGTRTNDGLSYFKKGGRVGCGVAKRGFGRAMKKGGKK